MRGLWRIYGKYRGERVSSSPLLPKIFLPRFCQRMLQIHGGLQPPPPSDWTIVKVVHKVALLILYWGGVIYTHPPSPSRVSVRIGKGTVGIIKSFCYSSSTPV